MHVCLAPEFRDSPNPPSSSHNPKRPGPGQEEPTVPIGTIDNPFRTAKAATNGNHRLCPKSKPQVKCG